MICKKYRRNSVDLTVVKQFMLDYNGVKKQGVKSYEFRRSFILCM